VQNVAVAKPIYAAKPVKNARHRALAFFERCGKRFIELGNFGA